jgi:hypothetical protein
MSGWLATLLACGAGRADPSERPHAGDTEGSVETDPDRSEDTDEIVQTDTDFRDGVDTDLADTDLAGADTDLSDTSVPDIAGDSGGTDTGDGCIGDTGSAPLAALAEDFAAVAVGSCDTLVDPWVWSADTDLGDLWALVTSHILRPTSFYIGICPCVLDEPWDCLYGDWTYAGRYHAGGGGGLGYAELGAWGQANTATGSTYLADGLETDGGGYAGWTGPVYESLRESYDDGTSRWAFLRDGIARHSVESTTSSSGWEPSDWMETEDPGLYLDIMAHDTLATGDLCIRTALEEVSGCPIEPSGTVEFVGAHDVLVTFDGDVACDGCGGVSVDGIGEGVACFSPE